MENRDKKILTPKEDPPPEEKEETQEDKWVDDYNHGYQEIRCRDILQLKLLQI